MFSPASELFFFNDSGGVGFPSFFSPICIPLYHTFFHILHLSFFIVEFAFALSFCFSTLILAGLVFGFFSFPLYFTAWSGSGYRIDLHDNSLLLLSCHSYFGLFCIAPSSSLLPSIKTTLYVPDTTCYD